MTSFNVYLNFDGNTREAMTFYQECLGAELDIMPFGDTRFGPAFKDAVMHARLSVGDAVIMASDPMPGSPVIVGNNAWINVNCDSAADQDRFFGSLGAGGQVVMPLMEQFWGARFGMLTDRYGVNWMFNYEHPKG